VNSARPQQDLREAFAGTLLGTAVGDALGLPAEGMSRQRIERRWHGQWRHRFLFGHGMVSDDTEHTLFVAQALLAHPNDPAAFQRCLAWKLRLWLLGIPAGIGFATLRAILKLWLGFPPARSGVHSAGNGPAMLSAIIGAYFFDEPEKRREFVAAATSLTQLAERLVRQKGAGRPLGPVRYFWPGLIPRNSIFLVAVLLHGFEGCCLRFGMGRIRFRFLNQMIGVRQCCDCSIH
jgi:hypothetical protein